jgi:hypothetical protein
MHRDYAELQSYAANLSLTTSDARVTQFLFSGFPSLDQGDYKIKVKHQLPGTGTFTSQNELVMHYYWQAIK